MADWLQDNSDIDGGSTSTALYGSDGIFGIDEAFPETDRFPTALIRGGNFGNGVAEVAHVASRHDDVRGYLHAAVDFPRKIVASQHRKHALQRLSGARINGTDSRVRVRATKHLSVQHSRKKASACT